MAVRRHDVDRQRDAVFLNGHLDLDATDLLATVNATRKAARRRAAGAAVDDHGARFRRIPAGAPPTAAQPIEQPTPEAEPGPAGEQSIERVEGDVAELSDRSPLHTAKTDTPDRHHRLAQRRSGQRRLGPERVGRLPAFAMGFSSASTSSTKASRSANASRGPGDVFAARTAVPIIYGLDAIDDGLRDGLSSFRAPLSIQPQVAVTATTVGMSSLQTDTKLDFGGFGVCQAA